MSRKERLELWAAALTEEQAKAVLVELVSDGIECETVSFWDDSLAPYWSNCGDPLVDGQSCFPPEDDEDE